MVSRTLYEWREGAFMSLTLTPNAFSEALCASLSHFERWRLQNTVNCKGKSKIQANDVRVAKVTCLESSK